MHVYKAGWLLLLGWHIFCLGDLVAREIRWTHFGLRPLGMGNAFVAVVDDYNALFYNPAGLSRLKSLDGELLNPTLEIAKDTLDFTKDLMSFAGGSSDNLASTMALIKPQIGAYHHFAFYWTPHLVFKNWGFGIGVENVFNLLPHGYIDFELEAGVKVIAPLSYAFDLIDRRLSLGFTVKAIAIATVDDSFNLGTITAFSKDESNTEGREIKDLLRTGTGIGADIGLLLSPEAAMDPTIGVSIIDLGGTPLTKRGSGSASAPHSRYPSVNAGISLKPFVAGSSYFLIAFDAHFINQAFHYSHKYNAGVEWGVGEILKIQTGLKEGYISAGFQFDAGLLSLRMLTYAVDHGPIVGLHKDMVERRYALQIKLLI